MKLYNTALTNAVNFASLIANAQIKPKHLLFFTLIPLN